MQVFKDLAKDCELFMNPQRSFREPRAAHYPLYELPKSRNFPPYNSTAPFWRARREQCFEEIRKITNKPTVLTLYYVVHNESSFCLPISDSPSSMGVLPIHANNMLVIIGDNKNTTLPLKSLSIGDPVLVKWKDRKQQKFTPVDNQFNVFGNVYHKVILPQPGTSYFLFEMDEK